MNILGLQGAFTIRQHDASACVLIDGRPVSLCEEERYTRQKHSWGRLPLYSIHAALKMARLEWKDIDLIAVPNVTYQNHVDRWDDYLMHHFKVSQRIEIHHHQDCHAACAYYGSGAKSALVVSLDSSGDMASGCFRVGTDYLLSGADYIPEEESLGKFYTALTQYCGFEDGDEYKLMGLAPYGTPTHEMSDLGFMDRMKPLSPFEPQYNFPNDRRRSADVAAYAQGWFEERIRKLFEPYRRFKTLCYAGGCALNCKANALLPFEEVHISPVAGDRGLSLGAAYLSAVRNHDVPKPLINPYLGQDYTNAEIESELRANGIRYMKLDDVQFDAAQQIADGKIIGWFQGRSEAGPRALGNRSILARADLPDMKDRVNSKIKFREEFRPFAPAVLDCDYSDWFDAGGTPHMTVAVKARTDELKAVTHIDGTSRVQIVRHSDNPRFYELIDEIKALTGKGVVLNTSFNLKGAPIVESPRDALMTFYGCGLDALYLNDFLITK